MLGVRKLYLSGGVKLNGAWLEAEEGGREGRGGGDEGDVNYRLSLWAMVST